MKKILFFDTETSGLPKNYKASAADTDNWPRIVQLAWIVTDADGKEIKKSNRLIKPVGFEISEDALKIHGHTAEKLEKEGLPIEDVLAEIMADISEADLVVCHNLSFDYPILKCEFIRANTEGAINAQAYCTMMSTTSLCRIPSTRGYKWPKLQELHKHLFGHEFEDAHDAMADIQATVNCYFKLKSIGHATPL